MHPDNREPTTCVTKQLDAHYINAIQQKDTGICVWLQCPSSSRTLHYYTPTAGVRHLYSIGTVQLLLINAGNSKQEALEAGHMKRIRYYIYINIKFGNYGNNCCMEPRWHSHIEGGEMYGSTNAVDWLHAVQKVGISSPRPSRVKPMTYKFDTCRFPLLTWGKAHYPDNVTVGYRAMVLAAWPPIGQHYKAPMNVHCHNSASVLIWP